MRTGTKRGPDYNHWDEIPALHKAALMISEDSHHALWKAVRDQNADRLGYLLQHKKCSGHTQYDVNHMFPALWNSTLLHVAAECEDVEVATMLFTSGAHLEQRNRYHRHLLLPEEVRVFCELVSVSPGLSAADRNLMDTMAKRLVDERNEQQEQDRQAAREVAIDMGDDDDDTAVDDNATVSVTEYGYWVQAWLWVSDDELETGDFT
jgi:hypothetical protein